MSGEVPYKFILTTIAFAVVVGIIVNFTYTTPKYKRVDEAFYGGAAIGSGHPDCLRTLPEGSQLLNVLQSRLNPSVSEGASDYKEMELLLSKMACLKKDLMSPSGIVEATRYQAFETAHDRIAVAELCGMCMSHNISSRDLDIIFATWRDRGKVLMRRLCTEADLKEPEVVMVEELFKKAYDEVYDIATSRCLKTDFSQQNGGSTGNGDVSGYSPENLKDLREYTNKYGGLSASGWNGAV